MKKRKEDTAGHSKPLTLHPMKLDEALKRFMQVDPEEYQAEEARRRRPSTKAK